MSAHRSDLVGHLGRTSQPSPWCAPSRCSRRQPPRPLRRLRAPAPWPRFSSAVVSIGKERVIPKAASAYSLIPELCVGLRRPSVHHLRPAAARDGLGANAARPGQRADPGVVSITGLRKHTACDRPPPPSAGATLTTSAVSIPDAGTDNGVKLIERKQRARPHRPHYDRHTTVLATRPREPARPSFGGPTRQPRPGALRLRICVARTATFLTERR